MSAIRLSSILAAAALVTAAGGGRAAAQEGADAWSLDGRAGLVSAYVDRGYDLSGGKPAMQGEIALAHAGGWYGGLWASTIEEYGVGADGDGAEVEVTLYTGWAGTLAGLDVDLGLWRTVYPDGEDVDYTEVPVQVGRSFGDAVLSLGAVWAPAQTGTGDAANTWVWTRIDYAPEAWPASLHATLGHEDGGFAPGGKTDWRLGLEAPAGPVTLGLDWVDSDVEAGALVASVFWSFSR